MAGKDKARLEYGSAWLERIRNLSGKDKARLESTEAPGWKG
jgi:hypothetical protein